MFSVQKNPTVRYVGSKNVNANEPQKSVELKLYLLTFIRKHFRESDAKVSPVTRIALLFALQLLELMEN